MTRPMMLRRRPARSMLLIAGPIICAAALMLPSAAGASTTTTKCAPWTTQSHSTSFRDGKISARSCLIRSSALYARAYVQWHLTGNLRLNQIIMVPQLFDLTTHKVISRLPNIESPFMSSTQTYRVGTHALRGSGTFSIDFMDDGKGAFVLPMQTATMSSTVPPPVGCGGRCN